MKEGWCRQKCCEQAEDLILRHKFLKCRHWSLAGRGCTIFFCFSRWAINPDWTLEQQTCLQVMKHVLKVAFLQNWQKLEGHLEFAGIDKLLINMVVSWVIGAPPVHPPFIDGFSRSQKPSSELGDPPFSELETLHVFFTHRNFMLISSPWLPDSTYMTCRHPYQWWNPSNTSIAVHMLRLHGPWLNCSLKWWSCQCKI